MPPSTASARDQASRKPLGGRTDTRLDEQLRQTPQPYRQIRPPVVDSYFALAATVTVRRRLINNARNLYRSPNLFG